MGPNLIAYANFIVPKGDLPMFHNTPIGSEALLNHITLETSLI